MSAMPVTPSRPPLTVHSRVPTTPLTSDAIRRRSDTAPHTPVGRHISLPPDPLDGFVYHIPKELPILPVEVMENGSSLGIDPTSTHKMMSRGERVMRWKPVGVARADGCVVQAVPQPVQLFFHRSEFLTNGSRSVDGSGCLYWNTWNENNPLKQLQARHCVKLTDIAEITLGKDTEVLRCASAKDSPNDSCCTILTADAAVDLEFSSTERCCAWLFGIISLIHEACGMTPRPADQPTVNSSLELPPQSVQPGRMTRRFSMVPGRQTNRESVFRRDFQLNNQSKNSTINVLSQIIPSVNQIRSTHVNMRSWATSELSLFQREMLQTVDSVRSMMNAQSEKFRSLELLLSEERAKRVAACNRVIELQGNIRVFCRVRPMNGTEQSEGEDAAVRCTTNSTIAVKGHSKEFSFDRVFDSNSSQADVYGEISPFVQSAIDGFAVCVFAYGQTGAGKTWTMQGNASQPGVSLRSIQQIFDTTQAEHHVNSPYTPAAFKKSGEMMSADGAPNRWFYSLSISAMEIYNETIADLLLDPSNKSKVAVKGLDIKHGPNGVYVPDLTEIPVTSAGQINVLIRDRVEMNRRTSATSMNERSSRSHSILMLQIEGRNPVTEEVSHGRLLLIDLAGSERVARSQVNGVGFKEATAINGSLSALGTCLASLQAKAQHIPYRNSKLTHLLSDCLGGQAKAVMLCQMSPATSSAPESLCSLHFASRARSVELGVAKRVVVQSNADETKKLKQQRIDGEKQLNQAVSKNAANEELIAKLRAELSHRDNTIAQQATRSATPPTIIVTNTSAPVRSKSMKSVAFDPSIKCKDENDENTRPMNSSPALSSTRARKRKEVESVITNTSSLTVAPFSSSLAHLVRPNVQTAPSVLRERKRAALPVSILNPTRSQLASQTQSQSSPSAASTRVKKLKSTPMFESSTLNMPSSSTVVPMTDDPPAAGGAVESVKRRMLERKQRLAAKQGA